MTTIEGITAFVLEIDRLKSVTRKVRPTGLERYENSAEHSWHIALLAWSLAPFAQPGVNMNRVIHMLLLHDIGEIDTGDTIFFAETGWEERKAAELQAVTRIFSHLAAPHAQEFLALWKEFEAAQTVDSIFANAADRALPVLLNLANGGGSWVEHHIGFDTVVQKVGPPVERGCPALWSYLLERLESAQRAGWFGTRAPEL